MTGNAHKFTPNPNHIDRLFKLSFGLIWAKVGVSIGSK